MYLYLCVSVSPCICVSVLTVSLSLCVPSSDVARRPHIYTRRPKFQHFWHVYESVEMSFLFETPHQGQFQSDGCCSRRGTCCADPGSVPGRHGLFIYSPARMTPVHDSDIYMIPLSLGQERKTRHHKIANIAGLLFTLVNHVKTLDNGYVTTSTRHRTTDSYFSEASYCRLPLLRPIRSAQVQNKTGKTAQKSILLLVAGVNHTGVCRPRTADMSAQFSVSAALLEHLQRLPVLYQITFKLENRFFFSKLICRSCLTMLANSPRDAMEELIFKLR